MNAVSLTPMARFAVESLTGPERPKVDRAIRRLSTADAVIDTAAVTPLAGVPRTYVFAATPDIRIIFRRAASGSVAVQDVLRQSSAAIIVGRSVAPR